VRCHYVSREGKNLKAIADEEVAYGHAPHVHATA